MSGSNISNVVEADEQSLYKEIFRGKTPRALIVFYADWCTNSRKLLAILPELAEKYEGFVKIVKVKVEDENRKVVNTNIYEKAKIKDYPTVVTFEGGIFIDKVVLENKSKEDLFKEVEGLILKILKY